MLVSLNPHESLEQVFLSANSTFQLCTLGRSQCLNLYQDGTDFYICFISYPDIKNWIRNIEQHASDNVNKILVGNKADMDESKRVCPTHSLFLQPFGFPCTRISCDYYATLDAGNLFSLGCSNFKGSSSGRRIRHQVFRNCKQHFLVVTLDGKASEIAVLFLMRDYVYAECKN